MNPAIRNGTLVEYRRGPGGFWHPATIISHEMRDGFYIYLMTDWATGDDIELYESNVRYCSIMSNLTSIIDFIETI